MKLSLSFLIAALPFFVVAKPNRSRGVTIPISKRDATVPSIETPVDPTKLRSQLALLQAKYDLTLAQFKINTGEAHPNSLLRELGLVSKKRATGVDSLTDSEDNFWYGEIEVGTPPVKYKIDFDTGSSDLFLPSSSCKDCGDHTPYDPSKSSTSANVSMPFKLAYGDGSTTSGELWKDVVSVAGLTAHNQTLGSATSYSSSFQTWAADGLMGLAFGAISSFHATPFFNTLKKAGTVTTGQFGFYLAKTGSELFLGGSDTSRYTGDVNWNDVTHEGYWQINLDSFKVAGKPAVSSLSVIIDSGTTLIVGDDENVKKFWAAVKGSQDASETIGAGFYTFPCAAAPSVTVTIGGHAYPIAASHLNLGPVETGSKDCVGSIVSGNEGFWIMGDAFMKNVYTIFDFDETRVGFAQLKI